MLHYLRAMLPRGRRKLSVNTLLAVLGVMIGCANIIALIGVTDTARHQALNIMRDFGANTLFITPYIADPQESPFGQRADANGFLPVEYIEVVRAVPEVDLADGVVMQAAHVGYGVERQFTTVEGVGPDYPELRGHTPARGEFISAEHERDQALVCCLGSELATQLFQAADPLGEQVVIKGKRYEVIGVMAEKGFFGYQNFDARVFIPLSTALEQLTLSGLQTILARAKDSDQLDAAAEAVETALRAQAGIGADELPEFSVTSVESLTGILDSSLMVFRFLMFGVSCVALIVAGIGIMNVMLMQVLGRTREIGVRRAVGARRRDIYAQFLLEALVISVVGAASGVVLGVAATLVFCRIMDWQAFIAPQTVLVAVSFSLGIGLLFGVYPAAYAARLKPIDCLRYE